MRSTSPAARGWSAMMAPARPGRRSSDGRQGRAGVEHETLEEDGSHANEPAGAVVELLGQHVRVARAEDMDGAAGRERVSHEVRGRRDASATQRSRGARRGWPPRAGSGDRRRAGSVMRPPSRRAREERRRRDPATLPRSSAPSRGDASATRGAAAGSESSMASMRRSSRRPVPRSRPPRRHGHRRVRRADRGDGGANERDQLVDGLCHDRPPPGRRLPRRSTRPARSGRSRRPDASRRMDASTQVVEAVETSLQPAPRAPSPVTSAVPAPAARRAGPRGRSRSHRPRRRAGSRVRRRRWPRRPAALATQATPVPAVTDTPQPSESAPAWAVTASSASQTDARPRLRRRPDRRGVAAPRGADGAVVRPSTARSTVGAPSARQPSMRRVDDGSRGVALLVAHAGDLDGCRARRRSRTRMAD